MNHFVLDYGYSVEVLTSIMYCPMMKTENVEMAHGDDHPLLFLVLILSNPPSLSLSQHMCICACSSSRFTIVLALMGE
jgi:hypothetical protein